MRLDDVWAWIDAQAAPLAAEEIALSGARGRILASAVYAGLDLPPFDRAGTDGFALQADDAVGASAYNPAPLRLRPAASRLAPGEAAEVQSGDPLPAGADAIARREQTLPDTPGSVAIIVPIAPGSDVERRGTHAAHGSILAPAGRHLDPADIALLASAGIGRVPVLRKPRVRCIVVADGVAVADGRGLGPAHAYDANGPMLAALAERDGAVIVECLRIARGRSQLTSALELHGDADLILVAGGTGRGRGDHARAALAAVGELAVHGVALRPGETAAAGRIGAAPVFLLPGAPAACLWTAELIAGRAVRRLAGRSPGLPFPTQTLRAARKIVSEIGVTEVCPVRVRSADEVEPMASLAETGLAASAEADGFVLVPEASEGYPQGTPVTVYLRR